MGVNYMGNQPGLHLTVKESIKGLESYVNLQGMGEIWAYRDLCRERIAPPCKHYGLPELKNKKCIGKKALTKL